MTARLCLDSLRRVSTKPRQALTMFPFAVFGLVAVTPILIAILAGLVGKIYGYGLNEGGPPDNSELGDTLYKLGVFGWHFLYTAPAALVASALYGRFLVLIRILRGRRRSA